MTTCAEMETIIRWDRETDAAILYTADPREQRRWRALGYDVRVCGAVREGKARSWQATVPVQAVALLALKGGRVQIPRWLTPPVVQEPPGQAHGPRDPEKADEIPEEIRTDSPGAAPTSVG